MQDLETMIGLEIHVPLKTGQKLFCDCPTNYYEVEEPNTNTCEVCCGMPGAKPHPMNAYALESAIMIGRLLNCEISDENKFVKRKHYEYPDLPSGYQRTSEPIGVKGELNGVGIWDVHIEEDPARYDLDAQRVDFNRSGVPLIEIVTAPVMKTPEDVRAFMKELVNLLRYTERIVDVGGVMRADVNISIKGGAKVEIKNINSVKGAYKAIMYEVVRQKNMMARGAAVKQETRGFNDKSMTTTAMRTKETAADYRYIPDPDIPPLVLSSKQVNAIELPETPQRRRERLVCDFEISEKYAEILVRDKDIADMFEEVAKTADGETAALWISKEVQRQLNYRGIEINESKLNAKIVSEVVGLIHGKKITESVAKKLLERVIDTGESPAAIVEKESLGVVGGGDKLGGVVDEVIAENEKAVEDYKQGNPTALNFLMGRVMGKMRGAAEPGVVVKLLEKKLK